jgi:hypothetical protein
MAGGGPGIRKRGTREEEQIKKDEEGAGESTR